MDKNKKKITLIIIILSIVAFAMTLLAVYDFYHIVEDKEMLFQQNTLEDFAKLESSVIEVKLEDYISTLAVLSEFMKDEQLYTKENMTSLGNIAAHKGFRRLGVITIEGMLYTTNNQQVDISDRAYFHSIMQGEQVITGIKDSRITENKVFIVAVPMTDSSGKIVGGLHGAVNLDDFQSYENTRLATESNCTYVIDRSGSYIIRGDQHDSNWDYSNIFEQIKITDDNMSVEKLQFNLQNGNSFATELTISGTQCMAYFEPLGINDWYTVVTIHKNQVENHISLLLDKDIIVLLSKVLITVVILCGVIIVLIQSESKKENESEKMLRERLMSGIIGFIVVDLDDDRILRCSRNGYFQQFIDFPFSQFYNQIISKKVHDDYHDIVMDFATPTLLRQDYEKSILNSTISFMAYYINDEDSSWIECERHLFKDSSTGHLIVSYVLNDISERKLDEFILKTKAERDLLTGLYNRSAATGIITQYIQSHKSADKTHAFIIVDLDNFKKLNDILGHQAGDQALKDVGRILDEFFRKEDVVCRLGGDEFIIFVKGISEETINSKLTALIKKLNLKYEHSEKAVTISASAGVAMFPDCGTSFNELYKNADNALYTVKRDGKSGFKIFNK